MIGKTDAEFARAGIAEYEKRLKYYIPYEMKVIPDVRNTKNMSEIQQKEREGELLLGQLEAADYVILLDEEGKRVHFKGFCGLFGTEDADKYETTCIYHRGPYGFSEEVYKRANMKISLSKMTFFSPDGEDDSRNNYIGL